MPEIDNEILDEQNLILSIEPLSLSLNFSLWLPGQQEIIADGSLKESLNYRK
jgi:hypothetical protein